MSLISVEKSYIEHLVLSYISTNLNVCSNKEISIYEGFVEIKQIDEKNNKAYICYKTKSIYHEEDYPYISENYNLFYDEVSLYLGGKATYTKKELKELVEEMHLKSENNVAFIIKLLRQDVKFINE